MQQANSHHDYMAMSVDSDAALRQHGPAHPTPQDEDKNEKASPQLSSEMWVSEKDGLHEYTIYLHLPKNTTTRVTEMHTKDGKFHISIEAVEIRP